MILETAIVHVYPGREEQFLDALEEAKKILAQSPGWREIRVLRGIERPSTVQLVIAWESLEHHTVEFRESDLFPRWRSILGPFFVEEPHVEHWVEAVSPASGQ